MNTFFWILAAILLAVAALVLLWARWGDAQDAAEAAWHEQRAQEFLGDGDMAAWRDAAGEW